MERRLFLTVDEVMLKYEVLYIWLFIRFHVKGHEGFGFSKSVWFQNRVYTKYIYASVNAFCLDVFIHEQIFLR